MTTAVIGATGRVGSEIVRGVLARGDAVTALVRDPGKARRAFGEPGGLHVRPTRLDDPRDLARAVAQLAPGRPRPAQMSGDAVSDLPRQRRAVQQHSSGLSMSVMTPRTLGWLARVPVT